MGETKGNVQRKGKSGLWGRNMTLKQNITPTNTVVNNKLKRVFKSVKEKQLKAQIWPSRSVWSQQPHQLLSDVTRSNVMLKSATHVQIKLHLNV